MPGLVVRQILSCLLISYAFGHGRENYGRKITVEPVPIYSTMDPPEVSTSLIPKTQTTLSGSTPSPSQTG